MRDRGSEKEKMCSEPLELESNRESTLPQACTLTIKLCHTKILGVWRKKERVRESEVEERKKTEGKRRKLHAQSIYVSVPPSPQSISGSMKMDEIQWSFVSALSMAKQWLRDLVKETV